MKSVHGWKMMAMAAALTTLSASADLLLSDFNGTTLGATYGSWDGALTADTFYMIIDSPATPSGGGVGAEGLNLVFNADVHEIQLTARLGLNNAAPQINVVLQDNDGVGQREDFAYFFATSAFNSTTFTTVSIAVGDWAYHSVVEGTPDGVANFDASGGMTGWHLQGNFVNNTDRMNVEVDNLNVGVVPEPGTLALSGIGLLALAVSRRMKKA